MGGKEVKETEAEIAKRIGEGNKQAAKNLRMKKMVDDAIDNMSPSLSGDTRTDAALVAEDMAESMGKVYDDLSSMERLDLYDQAYTALSKQRYKGFKKPKDSDADSQESSYDDGPADFDPDADNETFAQGGRAGFKDGPKLTDFLNVQAQGSKSGKQQIFGAPSGITIDQESYDFVANLDIPVSEKINLLANIAKGKGRTRIEKDDQEIFLDEGGSKSRNIGAEFNRGGEGLGGKIMYNLESGDPTLNITYKKSFADGGRAGFKAGSGKGILEFFKNMIKPKKSKFDKKRFEEGPIDLNFLENLDPKDLGPYLRTRDTMGRGGYGMYDNFADMPAGLRAAELIKTIKGPANKINYKAAELFLGKKLRGDESVNELLQILNRQEMRAEGGRIGYFMGSANPRGLGLLKELLNFFGKKSEVVKNPSDFLKVVNPKAFNKMLEDAKGKVIPKEGIMATDRIKGYQTQMAKDRVDTVKEMLDRGKRFKAADDKIIAYKNEVKEKFMKDLNMSEADAEIAADRMATLAMDVTKMEKTPKITEEGLLQLENVLKNMETGGKTARDLNADGGRIGFKDGMSRRTFLKLLGGLASIPIVGKLIKPLKLTTGIKKVPIIKTDNVPGKPEWFDALVNKVIIEGDNVTKKFATAERQSIHQKTLKDGSVVRVTEDIDDGAVRVEYDSPDNVFEDTVQMEYKKPLPDEGNPRPSAEFKTSESGPVGRGGSDPDGGDYDIDIDEVGGTSISDLDSDISILKEYATGKKPKIKELMQNIERKKRAKQITEDPEAQMDAVIARQGEYTGPYEDDFASGGIARMLGE